MPGSMKMSDGGSNASGCLGVTSQAPQKAHGRRSSRKLPGRHVNFPECSGQGLMTEDLGLILDVPLTIHMSHVSSFYICKVKIIIIPVPLDPGEE